MEGGWGVILCHFFQRIAILMIREDMHDVFEGFCDSHLFITGSEFYIYIVPDM